VARDSGGNDCRAHRQAFRSHTVDIYSRLACQFVATFFSKQIRLIAPIAHPDKDLYQPSEDNKSNPACLSRSAYLYFVVSPPCHHQIPKPCLLFCEMSQTSRKRSASRSMRPLSRSCTRDSRRRSPH